MFGRLQVQPSTRLEEVLGALPEDIVDYGSAINNPQWRRSDLERIACHDGLHRPSGVEMEDCNAEWMTWEESCGAERGVDGGRRSGVGLGWAADRGCLGGADMGKGGGGMRLREPWIGEEIKCWSGSKSARALLFG